MEIVLYRPEIPPNTGNIARLSYCTGSQLHIVGEPSFSLDDSRLRRAGIDYWDELAVQQHRDWEAFRNDRSGQRLLLFSRFAPRTYSQHEFAGDEALVFGRETSGLPAEIVDQCVARDPDCLLRIPVHVRSRSLNLSNAVAVVVYEALRQLDFPGVETQPPS